MEKSGVVPAPVTLLPEEKTPSTYRMGRWVGSTDNVHGCEERNPVTARNNLTHYIQHYTGDLIFQ